MQSMGFADSKHSKEMQDEINKMKKKVNILKRRNDDIENQHKEEIDIMVGVIEQCYITSFQGPCTKKWFYYVFNYLLLLFIKTL